VALVADASCVSTAPNVNPKLPTSTGYVDLAGNPIDPATAHFVQVPLGNTGNSGRNILVGPRLVAFDFSLVKSVRFNERTSLQLRAEFYDILNHANPGNPFGNVFTANAQLTPAVAFGSTATPARVSGATPENSLDAKFTDINGVSRATFMSTQFMNTGARRIQLGIRLVF